MLPTVIFSLFLLGAAAGLAAWHLSAWRGAQRGALSEAEYDFAWRQFRRRIQASAMLAVIGVAVLVGTLLGPVRLGRFWFGIWWLGVLGLVAWLMLLALADALAIRHHFGKMRHDQLVEEARLRAQVRRDPRRETTDSPRNGHPTRGQPR